MGNDQTGPSGSEADTAEQIEALRLEQDELWVKLRREDDPDARMALLARFSEVRASLKELTDGQEIDGTSGGRAVSYRVELTDQDRPQRQPAELGQLGRSGLDAVAGSRGYLPSGTNGSGHRTDDDAIQPVVESRPGRPGPGPGAFPFGSYDGPEAYPAVAADEPGPSDSYQDRQDDRPHTTAAPADGAGVRNPDLGHHQSRANDGAEPDQPAIASDPYDYGYSAGYRPPVSSAPQPTGQVAAVGQTAAAPSPSSGGLSSIDPTWRAAGLLAALAVVLIGVWVLLPVSGEDGSTESAAGTVEAAAAQDPAGPAADDPVASIETLLRGMGLDNVSVERRDGAVHLVGTVPTEAEREALIGAAQALAGTETIEASELTAAEPGDAQTEANARAAALQNELTRVVAATPVMFEVSQTSVTELHKRILNTVATTMLSYPGIPVTIVGFTDDTGDDTSNRNLSLARAESVRDYLVSQGVPAESLTMDAKGEDTSTGSDALANLERRVEFVVAVPTVAVVPPGEQLRIAIVAPSARNDLAFTQSMVDAVAVIEAERGNVEVSITDNTFVPEEAAAAIREYAAQDYDLVIAHGSQFGAPLQEIAPEYPDVAFAWGTASDTFGLPNVYAYEAAAEQGGYVIGALAARLSATGTLGVVGPIEVGDAQRYINGFSEGAVAEVPTANVAVTYTGSFSDLSLASDTAQAHLAGGADVMTGSAQMVIGAISVVSENGGLWFGTQSNQATLAPGNVVASQVYHWEVILRDIVSDIDNGNDGGRTYTANLANGGLVIEYNDAYALAPEVRQRGDELVAAIVAGGVVPAG